MLSVLFIYGIGRIGYSHKKLIRFYKENDDLAWIHLLFGVILTAVFFITLCAMNNTYWFLPYLTV